LTGHVEVVRDDLAERVGVGEQPRVATRHHFADRANSSAQGVEGLTGNDAVAVGPQHRHRRLTRLDRFQFGTQISAASEIGDLGEGARVAHHVGDGVAEHHR
jgi:hypothetical protein